MGKLGILFEVSGNPPPIYIETSSNLHLAGNPPFIYFRWLLGEDFLFKNLL
ncbi:hypothetical protein [Neobacillus niacini]|uniref:hypothetical protein n=1 Tax=Neobacillus niacini TaxID=86668 RepID=UPI003982F01A